MSPPSVVVAVPARIRTIPVPRVTARRLAGIAPVAAVFVAYLAVGLLFSLGAGIVTGDAWSRVGNAYYVLFSRDPHLAAIGFVWNPLPSLVELPLLPFAAIWRPIVDHGVAGSIMSAAFMALSVREVWLWLRDLAITRPWRIALTFAFAAHPLILLYGGNGMSEAPFLFFLIVTGRAFSSWLSTGATSRLAVAGIALAFAYLTRYEAVAPIAAVGAATVVASIIRARGMRAERLTVAVADALIVGAPPAGAFLLWALASWIIVGSPFATFSSVYGNSSQVGLSIESIRASTGTTLQASAGYLVSQVLGLEPLLPAAGLVALVVALVRRDGRLIAPIVVFGSVLAFSDLLFLAGGSFGWLRFSIAAVPLTVIVVGVALSRPFRPRIPAVLAPATTLVSAGCLGLALVGLPAAVGTVFDSHLAREESPQLHGLVAGDSEMPGERRERITAGQVAGYLDSQHLARGSVVVDVALGFWIVLQSAHPEQFVITPDRDFERVVADPATFHAQYLLVSPPGGMGALDALSRRYPGIYSDGGGLGELVGTFGNPDTGVAWRLYRVKR